MLTMCRYYAVSVCHKLSYFNLTTVSWNRYNYHFTEKVKNSKRLSSPETWLGSKIKLKKKKKGNSLSANTEKLVKIYSKDYSKILI